MKKFPEHDLNFTKVGVLKSFKGWWVGLLFHTVAVLYKLAFKNTSEKNCKELTTSIR